MHRRKKGTLRSGKGGKGGRVRSRKQAIAIGLSEARKKGAQVPSHERWKEARPAGRPSQDADIFLLFVLRANGSVHPGALISGRHVLITEQSPPAA
jgi:hypothetical protein